MSQVELTQDKVPAAAPPVESIKAYQWYVVGMLTLISAMQYLDRQVVSILMEPLRHEFSLSDSQLGLLVGACYAVPFALAGIPFGILADRMSCRKLLSGVLFFWSALTALCGFAGSYMQLVIARVGIGAAEAPTKPAAVSLISDLFPLQRRSTAIGLFWSGSSVGTVLAFVFGGYIATHFGWRNAFFIAGLPGILLALLFLFTVKDPPRRGADDKVLTKDTAATPVSETFRFVLTQPSLLLMYGALLLAVTTGAGTTAWIASFLVRVHELSIKDAGLLYGLSYGLTAWIGSLAGGRAADYLARKDVTWIPKVAAVATFIFALATVGILLAPSLYFVAVFIALKGIALTSATVPTIGLGQSLVGARMRATALSSFLVLSNLIAFGVGPQIIGSLNDFYSQWFGEEAIRYGMLSLAFINVFAIGLFLLSNRNLKADLERAAGM